MHEDTWRGWWERFAAGWRRLRGAGPEEDGGEGERQGGAGGIGAFRGLILAALLGAGLMVIGGSPREKPAATDLALVANGVVAPAAAGYRDVLDELEREVTVVLTQIAGVGNAEVVIVPATSEIRVFAEEVTERTNVSEASSGGREPATVSREESRTRRPVIINNGAQDTQEPLVAFTRRPEVAGVLVVADGADDPRVRLELLRAVSTLLDVPAHRVEVAARKR